MKFKIEYRITHIPVTKYHIKENENEKYEYVRKEYFLGREDSYYSDLDGDLKIYIDDNLFFFSDYILLSEFCLYIMIWLKNMELGEVNDFYYKTMDSDDEPIFALYKQDDYSFVSESAWELYKSLELINTDDITGEFFKYVNDFRKELVEILGEEVAKNIYGELKFKYW